MFAGRQLQSPPTVQCVSTEHWTRYRSKPRPVADSGFADPPNLAFACVHAWRARFGVGEECSAVVKYSHNHQAGCHTRGLKLHPSDFVLNTGQWNSAGWRNPDNWQRAWQSVNALSRWSAYSVDTTEVKKGSVAHAHAHAHAVKTYRTNHAEQETEFQRLQIQR